MRRVKETIPYEECKCRALAALPTSLSVFSKDVSPMRAARVADVIWPDTEWIAAQGAGAAASRILKRMEKEGLVRWISTQTSWGWVKN